MFPSRLTSILGFGKRYSHVRPCDAIFALAFIELRSNIYIEVNCIILWSLVQFSWQWNPANNTAMFVLWHQCKDEQCNIIEHAVVTWWYLNKLDSSLETFILFYTPWIVWSAYQESHSSLLFCITFVAALNSMNRYIFMAYLADLPYGDSCR